MVRLFGCYTATLHLRSALRPYPQRREKYDDTVREVRHWHSHVDHRCCPHAVQRLDAAPPPHDHAAHSEHNYGGASGHSDDHYHGAATALIATALIAAALLGFDYVNDGFQLSDFLLYMYMYQMSLHPINYSDHITIPRTRAAHIGRLSTLDLER